MPRLVYLESGLAVMPAVVTRLVRLIGADRVEERLSPDRFSVREIVAHLADLEVVLRGRMELAQKSPGAAVPNWDPDAEAIAKHYAAWEVEPTLERFAVERAATLELFRSLDETQLACTVRHAVQGEINVVHIATFALGHDAYHIDQLTQHLAEGRQR